MFLIFMIVSLLYFLFSCVCILRFLPVEKQFPSTVKKEKKRKTFPLVRRVLAIAFFLCNADLYSLIHEHHQK